MTDFDTLLRARPYLQFLGMRFEDDAEGIFGILPYEDRLIGHPEPPALHGGALAAFLETTAALSLKTQIWPRTLTITTSYLRPGGQQTTYARAHVLRQGRRYATVEAILWQEAQNRPIARAVLQFALA